MSFIIDIQSQEQLSEIFRQDYDIVVIDFYADWCYPCKVLMPTYEELAKTYSSPRVVFTKCNADKNIMPVSSLPTIDFYQKSQKIATVVGADIPKIKETLALLLPNVKVVESESGKKTNTLTGPNGSYKPKKSDGKYKAYGSYK